MGTRLDGCVNQFTHDMAQLTELVKVVRPCLSTAPEPVAQRFNQAVLIQLHSCFEVFLQCMLLQASFWNADKARQHLVEARPEQADNIPGLNPGQLGNWLASEVDFKNGGKRVRAAVRAVLETDLFPDDETDAYCMDLVAVRNIAIHQMARVSEANVGTVRDLGVIVQTRVIGESRFYSLVVSREFLVRCLTSVGTTVAHIRRELASNPLFASASAEDLLKGMEP